MKFIRLPVCSGRRAASLAQKRFGRRLSIWLRFGFHQVRGGGLTGGTGLIPWPIAAAHVCNG